MIRRTLYSLLISGAWILNAHAQVSLYTTSWESPTFTANVSAPPRDGWANGTGSGVSQTVTNELARTGTQSLKWNNTTNTSFYSIARSLNWSPSAPDKVIVSTYVRVASGTGANRLYGLYLTSSATSGLGLTVLGITIAGDGKVRAGTSWGATYSSSSWIGQAPAGTYENRWLYLELTCNRSTGAATAKISGFSNGAEFTANFTVTQTPAGVNLGSDTSGSTNISGVGYFDDLEIKAVSGSSFSGWDEQANGGGDAGDTIETAQSTAGSFSAIRGAIDGANDVDIYTITITNPALFSATTYGGTTSDTALWLFDADGKGVLFNEDDPDHPGSYQSRIDNRGGVIVQPGTYYLAVSLFGRLAAGCDGLPMWLQRPYNAIRIPDGPDRLSRQVGWIGNTSSSATYIISLTGVASGTTGDPADCPPPVPWSESYHGNGDAGDLPATAQIVSLPDRQPCQDPVTRIRGDFQGNNDADMYVICITEPDSFSATTLGGSDRDTMLWLFRCDGTGVLFNDDAASSSTQSELFNQSGCISEPGIYLLAITTYERYAVDANGQRIWNNNSTGVHCPNGPGAANPIAGWAGSTVVSGGLYNITLQGAYFVSDQGCSSGTACDGDIDNNGIVDDADLLIVLFDFGNTGTNLPADVDRNGVVDDADLLIVLFNFGCSAGG
ncbi:MAG: DVUA0089 family protein [Fimbriimonadales bacterium]